MPAASRPLVAPSATVPGSVKSLPRKAQKDVRGKQTGDVDWRQDVWRH